MYIKEFYQRCLSTQPQSFKFQQDNASTHTAAQIVREFVADLGREIIIWSPYSPDLNPVGNLWDLSIVESLLESMPRRVKTIIALNGRYTKYQLSSLLSNQ